MTAGERSRAVVELAEGRERLLRAVAEVAPAKWSARPSPEVWSPAECVEHIVMVEEQTMSFLESRTAPRAASHPAASLAGRDEVIRQSSVDRSEKRSAPERVRPSGGWQKQEAVERFRAVRARAIAFTESTSLPLRDLRWKHTYFGEIDSYQTLLFLAGHALRHTRQIEEGIAKAGHSG